MAAIVAILVGMAAFLLLQAGLYRSTPTLEEATRTGAAAVGQAVAGQFGHALQLGIPLDKLPGIEPYLQRIVASSPQVEGLALLDGTGRVVAATSPTVDGTRFPISVGDTKATLIVLAETPLIDQAVWQVRIALALTALLTGAVAGGLMAFFTAFHRAPAQRRFFDDMQRVATGTFTAQPVGEGRGPLTNAARALTRRIEEVKTARRNLVEAVATIHAIDFDGSLGRRVEPIVQPIEGRYTFGAQDEDEAQPAITSAESGIAWRLALIFALYGATFPYVANFAIDRESEVVPMAWAPVLPLLAELAAACAGAVLGRMRVGTSRTALAMGCLVFGASVAATYWCRSYDLFVLLRLAAGLSAAFVAAGLLSHRRYDLRPRDLSSLLIFAALFAAPLFAGIYAEAIGRRSGFLLIGIAILAAAPFVAGMSTASATGRSAPRSPPWLSTPDMLLAFAILPASAMILVELPIGIGFDDYLTGGAATALLAACALAAPAMSPLICMAALLAAAVVLSFPSPESELSVFAACALLGLVAGGMLKRVLDKSNRPWAALAAGTGVGLAAVGLTAYSQLPFAVVVAVTLVGFAAVHFLRRAAPDDPV